MTEIEWIFLGLVLFLVIFMSIKSITDFYFQVNEAVEDL